MNNWAVGVISGGTLFRTAVLESCTIYCQWSVDTKAAAAWRRKVESSLCPKLARGPLRWVLSALEQQHPGPTKTSYIID